MPKEHAPTEQQQPNRVRFRHDNPFPKPVVAGVLQPIVPRIPAEVTRWILVADVQKARGLKDRLKEIQLAWTHLNICRKIKGANLSEMVDKHDRVRAADDRTVVSALPQIHHKGHLIVARECREVLTKLNKTDSRNQRRKGLCNLIVWKRGGHSNNFIQRPAGLIDDQEALADRIGYSQPK